jgi:hypothetical protein
MRVPALSVMRRGDYTRRVAASCPPYNRPMDPGTLTALPGADLVLKGLRDLQSGIDSIEALLVQVGASNLRSHGLTVPERTSPEAPEHRLYARLEERYGRAAHRRHNALVRRLVSFERALPRTSFP